MSTTLYTVDPVTRFSAAGYDIVQAGTVVPDGVVWAIQTAAAGAGVTINTSAGGAPQLVQVPSYYNGGTGSPVGDSLPIGAEVKDSTGAIFEKTPGGWVSAGAQSGTFVRSGTTTINASDYRDDIQAAHNALPATGGRILLDKANYTLTSGVVITKPAVEIVGVGGQGQSNLLGAGSAQIIVPSGAVGITVGDGTSSQFQGPVLRNLHVRGGSSATGGVWLRRINNFLLDNVVCSGFSSGYGLFVDGTGNVCQYGTLRDCGFHNCQIGVDQLLTNGTLIFGGYFDGNNNGGAVAAGTVALRHRSGDTLKVIGTRIQFYETHADLQLGQGHELANVRFEGFTTAVRNAGANALVYGGTYVNAIIGGGGTAFSNLAAADRLTLIPGVVGSVTTVLSDAGTNTTSLIDRSLAFPSGGQVAFAGDTFVSRRGAGQLQTLGNFYVGTNLVVDSNGGANAVLFGAAQDTGMRRAATKTLALTANNAFRTGLDTTANRPSASTVGQGSQFYDTTLSKPIWSDGTNWRDASGSVV